MKRELVWAAWLIGMLLICGVAIYFVTARNSREVLWDGVDKTRQ
jgi:hypothetical protein